MALRNIVTIEDSLLRETARPVEEFDQKLLTLLDDMAQTMYHADGVGLAAPQIGILRRIAVVDVGDGLIELVNPYIVKTRGEQIGLEGCLSVPGQSGYVPRPFKVVVKAQDRYGKPIRLHAEGFLARAFCHEIDHLDGVLYVDKVVPPPDQRR